MLSVAAALVPVFLLIVIGAVCRRTKFPGDAFWPMIERLAYFVLFPALLIKELAAADLAGLDLGPLVLTLVIALYAQAALTMATKPLLRLDGPSFTSVFQGSVRFNTFAGLAAAAALFGPGGVAIFAVCVAVMVPQINVLCVAVLARYAYGKGAGFGGQLKLVAQNPLILGCLVGIALNLTGVGLPPVIGPVLDILGRASIAFGLLTVGAALELKSLGGLRLPILVAALLKLLLFPALMAAAATLVGLDGQARTVAVFWATMPTAPAAYILARQLGGNAELMAATITAITLLSALTIPPLLVALG